MGLESTRQEEGAAPGVAGTTGPPTGTTGSSNRLPVPPPPLPDPYRRGASTLCLRANVHSTPPVLPTGRYRYYRLACDNGTTGLATAPLPKGLSRFSTFSGIGRNPDAAPPVLPTESYRYYRRRGHRFLSSAPTLR